MLQCQRAELAGYRWQGYNEKTDYLGGGFGTMGFFRAELGHPYEQLTIGQKATFSRQITKQDVLQYMGLSGDLNPLYADSAYACRTKYEEIVVPANILAGFAQGAVATALPGLGSLTYAHSYRMLRPAHVGDTVTVEMQVVEMKDDLQRVVIRYRIIDQGGLEHLNGDLEVEPPQALKPILHHAYENF